VKDLVSIDFFTVPTVRFHVLFVFVVLAHERRRIIHFNVTDSPGAKWTAQQIVEAFPGTAPRDISSVTATASTVTSSPAASNTWASKK
jgi:hypothetical protein